MKTLIVMRHGKAMPPAPHQQDSDRSLTRAGKAALEARLPRMLRLLEAKGRSAQIWTSPAKRARQTAELLAKALEGRHVAFAGDVETHDCLWRQDVEGLLADLHATDADLVFAVGHIPFVEDVVEELTGSTPSFSTGALGCVEVRLADRCESHALPAQDIGRLQWFTQGPKSADWETLCQLQETITQVAEAIEDRRAAFFEHPEDIETIHRFRTYTRTLRSLIAFVKPWQEKEQNAETQTILRDIVRHTSRLRELDVFEKQARSNPDSSPELLALCEEETRGERALALKILASKEVTEAFEWAMAQARSIRWKKRIARSGLSQDVVRARFDTLVESVSMELAAVKLSDAEQTHDVRKRAKRARYVSEYNVRILGEEAVDIAKGMTAHQDHLGDVCDARANIRLINELLQRGLPESVAWELKALRAQNEAFLYSTLKAHGA